MASHRAFGERDHILRRPWLLAGALSGLILASALDLGLTSEGRQVVQGMRAWAGLDSAPAPELALPTPNPGRIATLYWLSDDGMWSVQQQEVSASLHLRIEQLSNLVLDRLRLDLLVVQAFVGEDDVAYLFFSVSTWEPSPRDETFLVESLTRTVLSDSPWLSGVRLVLPNRHLDYSRPFEHFDRGHDPLIHKTRSTLGLEVSP
jgi:hypothetical protein